MSEIILGIDVEEWYQTLAFHHLQREETIYSWPSRAPDGIQWIVKILSETHQSATFFVNGKLAEHFPELIPMIQAREHEIACHGYHHLNLYSLDPDEVHSEIQLARNIVTDVTGEDISGYRAPNWSVTPAMLWFWDLLKKHRFQYDASVLPFKTPWFGSPLDQRAKRAAKEADVTSVYPSILSYGPLKIPLGLGILLRLYPYPFTKFLIAQLEKQNLSVQLNIHAWELAEQPPPPASGLFSKLLTRVAYAQIRYKLKRLLSEYKVIGFKQWLTKNEYMID